MAFWLKGQRTHVTSELATKMLTRRERAPKVSHERCSIDIVFPEHEKTKKGRCKRPMRISCVRTSPKDAVTYSVLLFESLEFVCDFRSGEILIFYALNQTSTSLSIRTRRPMHCRHQGNWQWKRKWTKLLCILWMTAVDCKLYSPSLVTGIFGFDIYESNSHTAFNVHPRFLV